jgi:hypothetical protein
MTTKRKTILNTIQTLIEGIKDPSNAEKAFFHKVVRCHFEPWNLDPLPACSIWPGARNPRTAPDNLVRFDFGIEMHIVVSGHEDKVGDQLEDAISLLESMSEANVTVPGVWSKLSFVEDDTYPLPANKNVALYKVVYGVVYDRSKGNP